jgi:hypothetical protein
MYPPVYQEDPEVRALPTDTRWSEGGSGSDLSVAMHELPPRIQQATTAEGWVLIIVTLAFCILLAAVGGACYLCLSGI